MSEQGSAHLERHAEILQPRGEGVSEVMEMEIVHLGLERQTSPEGPKLVCAPSPEDSPIHVGDLALRAA